MTRWATFDCYGTLVDWNAGIREQLERIFGGGSGERLLARYHENERRLQEAEPSLRYREVMARALERIAADEGATLGDADRDSLGDSLPGWPIFPEVPDSLRELSGRGFKLMMLSNSDRDLIESSIAAIGVPFEGAVVASEIGSYKPAHRHWEEFYKRTGAARDRHVHVAQSHFHDIVPAAALGIPSIWINRLGESGEPRPSRELPDLNGLADAADELVPA